MPRIQRTARYTRQKLAFPSVKALPTIIGPESAAADMIELAVQEFAAAGGQRGLQEYVKALKGKHKVPSNYTDADHILRHMNSLHLSSVIDTADAFFRRFAKEVRQLRPQKKWTAQDNGRQLSSLEAIASSLSRAAEKQLSSTPEYALMSYYWACRNTLVHKLGPNEMLAQHKQLEQRHGSALRTTYRRPFSSPGAWVHGDRVLCSRVLLTLADMVNDHYALEVTEAVRVLLENTAIVASLRQKSTRSRLRRAAAKHARWMFEANEQDADGIAGQIEERLASHWKA